MTAIAKTDNNQQACEHLPYAIASTYEDGKYLIITRDAARHPIAFFKLKGNAIHWVNNLGKEESIGGDGYLIPNDVIEQALESELRILEMCPKTNQFVNGFGVNAEILLSDNID